MLLLRFVHDWIIASCCLPRRSCESLYRHPDSSTSEHNAKTSRRVLVLWLFIFNWCRLHQFTCKFKYKGFWMGLMAGRNMKGSIYLEANQNLGARKMENWETEGRLNDNLTKTEGSVEKLKRNYSLQHFLCYLFFTTVENFMRWRKVGRRISKEKQETP